MTSLLLLSLGFAFFYPADLSKTRELDGEYTYREGRDGIRSGESYISGVRVYCRVGAFFPATPCKLRLSQREGIKALTVRVETAVGPAEILVEARAGWRTVYVNDPESITTFWMIYTAIWSLMASLLIAGLVVFVTVKE
ncbi:hypothetical protein HNQ51_001346 [Inhella inkyongensis]|uniref:Uncharacterized protein n=1 Tax=Inhella inkyongensis TaxID=392593 RepID=A0A840S2T9_9BURK|nr:hypothetical protein [Inhella inkyongensis]MBB5204053.1 hypothetical protein [Inhella inkyongensis]